MPIGYGDPADLAEIQRPKQKKSARGKKKSPGEERRDVEKFTAQMRSNVDAAWRATKDWRMEALESYGFVEGEQWDPKDVRYIQNESPSRPILTMNDILPIVRILSGIERQNKQEFKIIPRAGGDVDGAQVLTECIRYVSDQNLLFYHRIRKSNDVNITGRGYLKVWLDYEDNINGNVMAARRHPLAVFNDPIAEDWDGRDRKWTAEGIWLTEEEAKEQWPQFEDQIKYGDWLSSESGEMPRELLGDRLSDIALFIDRQTKRVRLFDYWYTVREPVTLVVDLSTGDVEPLTEKHVAMWQQADAMTRDNYRFIKKTCKYVRIATFMNWLLLQDKESPLPHNFLPLNPYIGLQYYKEPFGVVRPLKDPQRLKNKGLSQALNHLNRSANSGWKNHSTKGADPEVLRKYGNVPGIVINYKDVEPKEMTPAPISVGHLKLIELGDNQMKQTSTVNAEIQGSEDTQAVSGKAIEARQKGGLIGNEDLFDNGLLGDKLVGEQILVCIQDSFTPERVQRVVENLALRDKNGPAAMMVQNNQNNLPGIIESALQDEYDYIVDRAAAMTSAREEQAAKLIDLVEKFVAAHAPPQMTMPLVKAAIRQMDIPETTRAEIEAAIDQISAGVAMGGMPGMPGMPGAPIPGGADAAAV